MQRCLTNCKYWKCKNCIKLQKRAKLGSFCNNYKKQNVFEKVFKNLFINI